MGYSRYYCILSFMTSPPCLLTLCIIKRLIYQQAMAYPLCAMAPLPRCAAPLPRCAAPPPRCVAPFPRCVAPLPRCGTSPITAPPGFPPRIVSPRPRCGTISATWPRSMLPPLALPDEAPCIELACGNVRCLLHLLEGRKLYPIRSWPI